MKKFIRWINVNFEPVVIMVAFIIMTVLISVNVLLRFGFKSGFSWGEEMATYLFVWTVFTGISYAFRNNRQISVDFVKNLVPEGGRKIVALIIEISMLVLVGILLYGSINTVMAIAKFGDKATSLPISQNWLYGAAVYGFILSAIRLIQSIIWKVRRMSVPYELYMNVGGNYSGADQICFMPQSYRDEIRSHLNPELVEIEKKYSNWGGNE